MLISLSDAQRWGPDELGPTETIVAGGSRVFSVPSAFYDIAGLDCTGERLFEEFLVDLTTSQVFTYAG